MVFSKGCLNSKLVENYQPTLRVENELYDSTLRKIVATQSVAWEGKDLERAGGTRGNPIPMQLKLLDLAVGETGLGNYFFFLMSFYRLLGWKSFSFMLRLLVSKTPRDILGRQLQKYKSLLLWDVIRSSIHRQSVNHEFKLTYSDICDDLISMLFCSYFWD